MATWLRDSDKLPGYQLMLNVSAALEETLAQLHDLTTINVELRRDCEGMHRQLDNANPSHASLIGELADNRVKLAEAIRALDKADKLLTTQGQGWVNANNEGREAWLSVRHALECCKQ